MDPGDPGQLPAKVYGLLGRVAVGGSWADGLDRDEIDPAPALVLGHAQVDRVLCSCAPRGDPSGAVS